MAFPVSIDATTVANNLMEFRPFLSSAGNVYCILAAASSAGLTAYKATDPSTSFSSVGTGPTLTVTSFSIIQDSDLLHIITADETLVIYKYHKFNMATDTWDTTNETIADVSGKAAPANLRCSIAYRAVSGDELVVSVRGLVDTIMGADYQRIDFYHKNKTGTTWTGPVAIDDAGEVNYVLSTGLRNIAPGASNRLHVSYNTGEGLVKTIKTNNTLSAAVAAITFLMSDLVAAVTFDSSGSQKIRFNSATSTGQSVVMLQENASTGDIEWETPKTVDNIIAPVTIMGMAYDTGTTLRALGLDVTADDMMLSSSTNGGTTWDTWADIDTSPTALSLRVFANIYTRGGNKVLAYIYDNSGDPYYSEYVITAGGAARRVFLIS